jgi:CubicO group peptidase (beta-lactamase class C family)
MGPDTRGGRALSLNGAFGEGAFNRRDVHAAELPAANGITDARSLATIYAAAIGAGPGGGPPLVSESTMSRATRAVTPPGEADLCLVVPTSFAMGFMTPTDFAPLLGPGSFGHPGAGGSVACADPAEGLAFAYAMNAMAANLAGDTRAQHLIDAVRRCAGSA